MANSNSPQEPPPTVTAAELRRRLLASTPPPLAATSAIPDPEPAGANPDVTKTSWASAGTELLSRLRMPGVTGSPRVPDPRPMAPPASEDAANSTRTSVTRRTPVPHGRGNNYDALSASMHGAGASSSSDRMAAMEDAPPLGDTQRYRAENKELRSLLSEMKQLLQDASDTEARFVEKEKGLQAVLEEKDRQVQELSTQLQLIEDQIAKGELAPPPPILKTRGELEEWSDELEKESFKIAQERKVVNQDRQQLREDEEALEKQMREMEISMARERALIGRQETELKRLSAEIQHELEIMQRGDATLRDQMTKFQRRAQDVLTTRPSNANMPSMGRR